MLEDSMREVFDRVDACFVWQRDEKTFGVRDFWQPFTDEVRAGLTVRRDCDDFALTVLVLGAEDYGWDLSQMRVVRVLTDDRPVTEKLNHAIAIYKGMVFDNLKGAPYPVSLCPYRFYDYSPLPLTDWRLYMGGKRFNEIGRWE